MTTEIKMSTPERAIYNALLRLGYKEGTDFIPQAKMLGGRNIKGGLVADFQMPGLSLIIRVQGEYWHSAFETKARDELQRIYSESDGWRVVDIMAADALRNPTFYVKEAIRGVSHAHQL